MFLIELFSGGWWHKLSNSLAEFSVGAGGINCPAPLEFSVGGWRWTFLPLNGIFCWWVAINFQAPYRNFLLVGGDELSCSLTEFSVGGWRWTFLLISRLFLLAGGINFPLLSRAGNSLIGVPSKSLFFCPKMSEWAIRSKKEQFTHSLIFGEPPERFAHNRSFPLSAVSELLMVAHFWWRPEQFAHIAHFWWATWAIHSHPSSKKREWAIRSF